jgi:broad specificity phosphatase PhoE
MTSSRRVIRFLLAAVATVLLVLSTALPAWAAEIMTVTFVRHGESEANAANVLDTAVPGPGLTELGEQQAGIVAGLLAARQHDSIYASTMIRTQQTAKPLSDVTGTPVTVVDGLQEISGGVFEGGAERGVLTLLGYGGPPLAWTFGLRSVPILGSSDTGNSFDARVDGALQDIYDDGDRDPVVFAHGATIMFWTMMNVDNPDPFLILTHPLDNTDVVVVDGNATDGWTLRSWAGQAVDPNPSLVTRVFVVVRDVLAAVSGAVSAPAPIAPGITTNPAPVQRTTNLAAVPDEPQSEPETKAETKAETTPVSKRRVTEGPEPATPLDAKANGATDLSDGNKAEPGTVHTDAATGTAPASTEQQPAESASVPVSIPESASESAAAENDSQPAAA